MTTRSNTAVSPSGNFFPVSVLVSLIVLIAALFVVQQTVDLPLLSSGAFSRVSARTPFFRGLVYLPQFRFMPLFRSAEPDTAAPIDENQMPPEERINRWEPFIREASRRFAIPEQWIRTVINIESGGRTMLWGRPITSGAGAMGVMQLMRDTYNEMSARQGLGSDPYNVHDNILAGTAYLRELYNQYGYPRLFAAYNAGPGVLEAHLTRGLTLPAETRNYIRMAVTATASPGARNAILAAFMPKPVAKPAKLAKVAKTLAKPEKVAVAARAVTRIVAKAAPVTFMAVKSKTGLHRVAVKLASARQMHVTAKPVHASAHVLRPAAKSKRHVSAV